MTFQKKYYIYSTFLFLTLILPQISHAEIRIVTTTEDIASITTEIGRDKVEVSAITRGYQDTHYIEAKPSYMVKANRADLLIYQGLELEVGWLPLLIRGARNPQIMPGGKGLLNLSSAIVPLEVPVGEVDRSRGDIHPLGNPHYHLDPENGLMMASAIAEKLKELDPENAAGYTDNWNRFRQKLESKIIEWQSRLDAIPDKRVVTYHTTWSYFLHRFGIQSVGTLEDKPGVPPSPRHLADLANKMNREKIKIILAANYHETRFSELLASKTGARILSMPVSTGGVDEVTDYIGLFDYLVERMAAAFQSGEKS